MTVRVRYLSLPHLSLRVDVVVVARSVDATAAATSLICQDGMAAKHQMIQG
jgi:hypothetical protein